MDRLADIQHVLTYNSRLTTTVALAGVSTALLLYYITRPKVKYPLGPRPWPIIGNIPQILSSGLETFLEKNRALYGNVYTIELSGSKRVVISGYENFHKLLVRSADHTSTRSTKSMSPVIQEAAKTTPGLFWAPYPHWKTMRSFSLATMREDGMGRAVLEPKIIREIEQFLSHFVQSNHGKPMEMSHSLAQATCNVMSQLLYGRRFEYDDETFNQMIESVDEQLKLGILISVATSIPFGTFLMRSHVKRDHYIAHNIQLPVLNSYIEENKKNLDASDPKGVIDKFILHMQSAQEDPKQGCFSDSNAAILSIQLYVAGTETTSTALRWALLYMCLYPDIQQRAQAEIDDVIGQEKEVSNKDRRDMPFVDAVLLETLRIGNIAPTGLPHTVDIDTEIDGQMIPAGTDLMFNFTSVLYDENVFEEPHTFKPDRYLEGDIVLKKQRTITFGLGRRACLGESLAKMEFFMFFVTFLQRYTIRFPEGYTASTEPQQNPIVRQPQDYQIIFEPR